MEREKVLTVRDLSITFTTTAGPVRAIRGVNLDLYRGETLAIVGESGSGKSDTVKAAMGILAKNGTVDSGSIEFTYHHDDGTTETVDILKMKKRDIRHHINGKRIAMIFQDPMTSLDPTMPIGKQIMEGMIWHYKTPKAEAHKRAVELLKEVGITDAEERMKNYPHQLSGGMRQRVVIAIALACNPELLICDEPTTALDVTIQAQILSMICDLQRKYGTSVIMITHDLGVVAETCDKVGIMYAGEMVEYGTLKDIFTGEVHHPYTKGLFGSIPSLTEESRRLHPIEGLMPDPTEKPAGCRFAPRCTKCMEQCKKQAPKVYEKNGHQIRCHLYENLENSTREVEK